MRRLNPFVISVFLITISCGIQNTQQHVAASPLVKPGMWRCELDITHVGPLPFDLEFTDSYNAIIRNDKEAITVSDIVYRNDSVFIMLPVFDSEIRARVENNHSFSGYWYNYSKGKDYKIAFRAEYGEQPRWYTSASEENSISLNGETWEVTFSPGTNDAYKAIGLFTREGSSVHGTFITETGDYRYLEGNVTATGFALSSFDGSHAFLFHARVHNGDTLKGMFYSGTHWSENWVAHRNPDAKLSDPYSLTYIKEGYDGLEFAFPDLDSNVVHFPEDDRFRNKVVVLQIMGSWCPNCMDETNLLTELHKKYGDKGLSVVSLCFEKPEKFHDAVNNIHRHKDYFGSNFLYLYAGKANKLCANRELPMLNHIMSFPTCIFIDKRGDIRKIHTGFYGPGTGSYYSKTVADFENLIVDLLKEE